MRNENVAVNRIDNNAIKEANVRTGVAPAFVEEFRAETGYYAAEFGRPAAPAPLPSAPVRVSGYHGEVFENHQNAVFNARTFFQAGPVQPSRRNQYGFRATGAWTPAVFFSASGSQRKVRGMVNGNVLVPLASERTPTATDPAVRALVSRFLAAYPAELPNRLDFDPRALNRNAPQRIDDLDGAFRLDGALGRRGKVSASHSLTRQNVRAFQLVAGQNPDNEIHTHRAQAGWRGAISPAAEAAVGFVFSRTRSVLLPEPNAVPMRVRVGYQIEELGPDSEFPVNRAQNSFRYGAAVTRRSPAHELTAGGDLARYQLNGLETASARGYFAFTANFGRSAIENLRLGTPSFYEVTMGEMHRGFRNLAANVYLADRWRVRPGVQLYFGIRHNLVTAPVEVNGYNAKPYACDCNNVSPRFSLAAPAPLGWLMRTSYTVSFAEIPAVTFQQVRFNLPHVRYFQVQNPDLLQPLGRATTASSDVRSSPTVLSPDLVSPYVHQFGLSLERKAAAGSMLRLAYIGSRHLKGMGAYVVNRALPSPTIRLALDTVDERRADPRYYEVRQIVNAGSGHFHGGQVSYDLPSWRGFRANLSYVFSKATDDGQDFAATAANRDLSRGRSQSEIDVLADRKGLSNFDATHALLTTWSYELPRIARLHGFVGRLLDGWQLAGVTLHKSGTPLTLYIGSDAPGFGNVDGSASDRPNILDPSILGRTLSHPDTAPKILSRDKFAYIRPGELRGNLGRNTFRKARIGNMNASLSKQWVWRSRREWRAQFRAEIYNATNTPQFDEPQRNLSAPPFGKITNTLNDGRVFQFGVRFIL